MKNNNRTYKAALATIYIIRCQQYIISSTLKLQIMK